MALTGNQNNINILIQSSFDNKGFQAAITAVSQLVNQLNNVRSGLSNVQKVSATVSQSMGQVSTTTQSATRDMAGATRGATQTAEAYRQMASTANVVKQNATYMGQSIVASSQQTLTAASNMGQFTAATAQSGWQLVNTSNQGKTAIGGLASGIGSAVSSIGGYFGGLIKHTISVGDIFGYYIGMMALQAVQEMTIGIAAMREEMESMFIYMGEATSTVEAFSDELLNFAVAMPTLSIGGVNEIARTLALGGADLMEISQYKQTWADMAEIASSLNGISAEAAAAKVGPAITDAMGGAYKRLLNVMNVTADQFKAKAGEMGIATEGSFSGTMEVLTAILSERGLAGVASKMMSLSDVWNYVTELIMAKGSLLGDALLPTLKTIVTAFGALVNAIPLPIFAMILAFTGVIGFILVFMPLIAALIGSFSILKLALQPVTDRLKKASMEMKNYAKMTNLAVKEHELLDRLTKDELKAVGVKRVKSVEPGENISRTTYYEKQDDEGLERKWVKARKAAQDYNNVTYKGVAISSALNKESVKMDANSKTLTSRVKGLGSGFKNMGTSIGTATKSMGLFMLTNPIGIILTLIGAILLIVTYTQNWGRVMDLINKIMTELANIIDPLIGMIVDLGERGWNAIKKWEGWEQISEFIQEAYDNIKGFAEYVSTLNTEAEAAGGGIQGLGNNLNYAGEQANIFTSNIVDGTGGTQSLTDAATGLNFMLMMLSNPITAIVWLTDTLAKVMYGAKVAMNEWFQTAEGGLALEELNLAIEQLMDAWTDLNTTLNTSATQLKPILDQLGTAWSDLMEAIYGKKEEGGGIDPTGGTGGETSEKITLVKLAVDGLKLAIGGLTAAIKIAIPIINFIGEVIKFVGWVVSGVMQIITFGLKVWTDLSIQANNLTTTLGPLGGAFQALMYPIMVVIYAVIELWHWITGNSPGLIPAFTDLYLLITSIWPIISGIVTGAINAILGVVSNFVNQTLSWFGSLPGQIGAALSSLQGYVVQEFWDAYYGAQAMIGQFFELGKQIKDQVVAGIKSALGISSPSKVTYGLGEFIAQGLIDGMTDWVKNNVSYFSKNLAKDIGGVLQLLSNMFAGFHYQFYYDSMYSVSTVLQTMTGNCWDAAQAFISLASQMGLTAQLYRTFVNGIPHMVVNLPQVGMWIDPSGILGTGLKGGTAPGSPAGAPIIVYVNDPVVKEEEDINSIAKKTGTKILDAVRFGI